MADGYRAGIDPFALEKEELVALQADIEDALKMRRQRNSSKAFAEITEILDRYEVTFEEVLGAAKAKSGGRGQLPPKFRDPREPSRTWSGKGRKPAWFREALDRGVTEDEMRISG